MVPDTHPGCRHLSTDLSTGRSVTVDIDGRSRSTYGRTRSISTVDHDQPTGEYGRYRRSITINLRRNTVDIDGRSGSTYGELGRSSMSTGSIEGVGSVDLIDDTCTLCAWGPNRAGQLAWAMWPEKWAEKWAAEWSRHWRRVGAERDSGVNRPAYF